MVLLDFLSRRYSNICAPAVVHPDPLIGMGNNDLLQFLATNFGYPIYIVLKIARRFNLDRRPDDNTVSVIASTNTCHWDKGCTHAQADDRLTYGGICPSSENGHKLTAHSPGIDVDQHPNRLSVFEPVHQLSRRISGSEISQAQRRPVLHQQTVKTGIIELSANNCNIISLRCQKRSQQFKVPDMTRDSKNSPADKIGLIEIFKSLSINQITIVSNEVFRHSNQVGYISTKIYIELTTDILSVLMIETASKCKSQVAVDFVLVSPEYRPRTYSQNRTYKQRKPPRYHVTKRHKRSGSAVDGRSSYLLYQWHGSFPGQLRDGTILCKRDDDQFSRHHVGSDKFAFQKIVQVNDTGQSIVSVNRG
jgi:hypothetical protein